MNIFCSFLIFTYFFYLLSTFPLLKVCYPVSNVLDIFSIRYSLSVGHALSESVYSCTFNIIIEGLINSFLFQQIDILQCTRMSNLSGTYYFDGDLSYGARLGLLKYLLRDNKVKMVGMKVEICWRLYQIYANYLFNIFITIFIIWLSLTGRICRRLLAV